MSAVQVQAVGESSPVDRMIVGKSKSSNHLRQLVRRVAQSNASVMITGPSGAGKEVLARAIHEESDRAGKPFIALNCGAIPSELIESELFGHERGAFTGAHARRIGRFEEANGGTLFLDEIGELHPELQPKLLRLLQEREYQRLGGSQTLCTDVRLVVATNRDLGALVQSGHF